MPQAEDALRAAVLECQRCRATYPHSNDPETRMAHQAAVVQLYDLMLADLHGIAASWVQRDAQGTETLVANLFTNLFIALAEIDAAAPMLLNRLLTVAVYGMAEMPEAATSLRAEPLDAIQPCIPAQPSSRADPIQSCMLGTAADQAPGNWQAPTIGTLNERRRTGNTADSRKIHRAQIDEPYDSLRLFQHPVGQNDLSGTWPLEMVLARPTA